MWPDIPVHFILENNLAPGSPFVKIFDLGGGGGVEIGARLDNTKDQVCRHLPISR